MVAKTFITQTDEGTITIDVKKVDGKLCLFMHDGYNSFDCRCDVDHLIDLKKFFKRISGMEGERQSYEWMMRFYGEQSGKWFYGNYIKCHRATIYIKALEDVGRPTNYKIGNLKRMSTKNLMELYNQNNVRKVILQKKKGR